MIAYDLDGVLMPDVIFDDRHSDEINEFRTNRILPLFQPTGKWGIITSRNTDDRIYVEDWVINQFSQNPPQFLLHDRREFMDPGLYKLDCLNRIPAIKVFVESDYRQFQYLQQRARKSCKVVWFTDLVLKGVANELSN